MKRIFCLLLCGALFLGGCAQTENPPYGYNDVEAVLEIPDNDQDTEQQFSSLVYYWASDQNTLEGIARDITVQGGQTRAEALLREMFQRPAEGNLQYLRSLVPTGTRLLSLENTQGVATVNLSAEFLQISRPEMQFAARLAITNTLTAMEDISHVVLLVEGHENGIQNVPLGAWERKSVNYESEWLELQEEVSRLNSPDYFGYEQSIRRNVVVYFAASGGEYLLPEVREGMRVSPTNMAGDLLRELLRGPSDIQNLSGVLPEGLALPLEPRLEQGAEGRILTIALPLDFFERLEEEGLRERSAFASMTLTMFGFIPGLESVRFTIGGDLIVQVGALTFEEGRMRRVDYEPMVGRSIVLYLPGADREKLVAVHRTISHQSASRPRAIMRENLIAQQNDAELRIVPHGVRQEDLLGIWVQGDRALLNFSEQFQSLCAGMLEQEERLMIYSMVNALTELPGVRRVRFFVNGREVDAFAGHVYMLGDFLRNTSMVGK